jgi:putative membrane protein insertion efficiency factor
MIRAYLLLLLRAYKAMLSPVLPKACRFVPTCSEYAMEAVDRYGAFRGGLRAMWRILRCHPFSPGGYDPVILPEKPAGTPACVCQSRDARPERPEAAPQPEFASTTLRPSVRRC